ncbi:MAG: hypothetical protein IT477_10645 [Rhodanobacteraceae bacterium]|nr:hypothetical protein [Rhodanobacteraceae bacterium]
MGIHVPGAQPGYQAFEAYCQQHNGHIWKAADWVTFLISKGHQVDTVAMMPKPKGQPCSAKDGTQGFMSAEGFCVPRRLVSIILFDSSGQKGATGFYAAGDVPYQVYAIYDQWVCTNVQHPKPALEEATHRQHALAEVFAEFDVPAPAEAAPRSAPRRRANPLEAVLAEFGVEPSHQPAQPYAQQVGVGSACTDAAEMLGLDPADCPDFGGDDGEEQPSVDQQYQDCINSGNVWCGSFCAPKEQGCGGPCPQDFVSIYDNSGYPVGCVHKDAGQPCQVDGKAGSVNDAGQCIPNNTTHITTQQQANDYCENTEGPGRLGFLNVDANGDTTFGGCCPEGAVLDDVNGGCTCPPDTEWDGTKCGPKTTPGPSEKPPAKPEKYDCVAIYGPNHYAIWSEADQQYGCIECRSDERGMENGLCYCKPGTVRKNPGDVTSPCVPASTGPEKPGPEKPGPDKPTGEKSEKKTSVWPWLLLAAGVVAAGVAVASSSDASEVPPEELDENGKPLFKAGDTQQMPVAR